MFCFSRHFCHAGFAKNFLSLKSAALDSVSEKKVVASLQQAMEHTRSMVMVTHRLGVIRALDVNRVIVLDKGEIVESGNPEDLLRQDSLYAALAREQGIQASGRTGKTHRIVPSP